MAATATATAIEPCPNVRQFIHPHTHRPALARCMRLSCPACREIKRRDYLRLITGRLIYHDARCGPEVYLCSIEVERWKSLAARLRSVNANYIRVHDRVRGRFCVVSDLPFYGIVLDDMRAVGHDEAIEVLGKIIAEETEIFEKMITTSREWSQCRWREWMNRHYESTKNDGVEARRF